MIVILPKVLISDSDLPLNKISFRKISGTYKFFDRKDVFNFKYKPLNHRHSDKYKKKYDVTLRKIEIFYRFLLLTH